MLLLIAAAPLSHRAAAQADLAVVVRTYDYTDGSRDRLSAARKEAEGIFRKAHISVRWIDCEVPNRRRRSNVYRAACRRRDLMMRLLDRGDNQRENAARAVGLGESLVDRERSSGVLMTLDLSAIRGVAADTAVDIPTLLGRAIAHEIGHLLLGSSSHPRDGLMRALWSQEELRGLKPAYWGFSPERSGTDAIRCLGAAGAAGAAGALGACVLATG